MSFGTACHRLFVATTATLVNKISPTAFRLQPLAYSISPKLGASSGRPLVCGSEELRFIYPSPFVILYVVNIAIGLNLLRSYEVTYNLDIQMISTSSFGHLLIPIVKTSFKLERGLNK